MRRSFWLLLAAVFWLAACASPAAAPATQAPAQPAEQRPAAQPTEAPAAPAQPAPAATLAPLPTGVPPKLNPPRSGGVLNPPTNVPTPGNNPAGIEVKRDFWREDVSTNRPPARYDHAFAFEFEVYTMITFGGRAQSTLGDTWITEGAGWSQLSPKVTPSPRFGAAAVYESTYPLIFGGQSDNQFFSDVWKYKSPPNAWEQIATTGNAPAPRVGASIGVETNPLREPYHNLLFVTHGYSDRAYFNDTFVLDLTTNTWEEISPVNRPSKRKGQAGAFDARQGKLFLFGGQDVAGNLMGDLWELDPAKRIWTKIPPSRVQPSPRSGASLTYDFNRRLWLFGGETNNGMTNELWMYDIASKQWSLIDASNKPSARSRHKSACSYDGESCYIFGGQNANGNALNDLWIYTP
ncbi:hypothetical protein TFLX_01437 [Thermoflexales bacterium]|nr:hypothetical protein TFLX_01437 [Thermoflexales bacterium]